MPAATADFQILSTSVTPGRREHGDANREGRCRSIGQYFRGHEHQLHGHCRRREPGAAGDFVAVATPQTLNFAANQALATIEVTINGDDDLEGLETVLVTLSGGTTVAGRDVATVTIADDDILINEVLANVSNRG